MQLTDEEVAVKLRDAAVARDRQQARRVARTLCGILQDRLGGRASFKTLLTLYSVI